MLRQLYYYLKKAGQGRRLWGLACQIREDEAPTPPARFLRNRCPPVKGDFDGTLLQLCLQQTLRRCMIS